MVYANPYTELCYVKHVRYTDIDSEGYFSSEDIIRVLCEREDQPYLRNELRKNVGRFKGLPLAFIHEFDDDEGLYRAVPKNCLLRLLSVLPGRTASQYKDAIAAYELRERSGRIFIESHQGQWKEMGELFELTRKAFGLPRSAVAKEVGVAASTIYNFERGRPIRRSRFIQSAYSMFLELKATTLHANDLLDSTEDLMDLAKQLEKKSRVYGQALADIDLEIEFLDDASAINSLLEEEAGYLELDACVTRLLSVIHTALDSGLGSGVFGKPHAPLQMKAFDQTTKR